MAPTPAETTHTLRFTIYVEGYGHKSKIVRDKGRVLNRVLREAFGEGVVIHDHRGKPIDWDPDEHDFGLGEA